MRVCLLQACAVLVVLLLAVAPAEGAVRIASVFSDHMVLQRELSLPVWGTARPGETVTLVVTGQTKTVRADASGRWRVKLEPLKPGPALEMTVSAASGSVTIRDILVGDVWLFGGQSNMALSLQSSTGGPAATAAAGETPQIRLLQVETKSSVSPRDDIDAAWAVASPQSARSFSAVAFYFGRKMHAETGVPVGLIQACWSGTQAENWIEWSVLQKQPAARPILDRYAVKVRDYESKKASIEQQLTEWEAAKRTAAAAGAKPPERPDVWTPDHSWSPAVCWNGMMHPIKTFGLRGAVWYQGEGNAGRAYQYRALLPDLIRSWRDQWQQGDFPFVVVQLPKYGSTTGDANQPSNWAELREAQLLTTMTVPKTALSVMIDTGNEKELHPPDKQPVGERAALTALKLSALKDVVASGPVFRSVRASGDKLVVRFDPVSEKLVSRGGTLRGFAVAGQDGKFFWAQASLAGNRVTLSALEVKKPVYIRYGWQPSPDCTLFNDAGWPASPFRTDDFPGSTINER